VADRTVSLYPASASARDQFVLDLRGPRPQHDAFRHQGVVVEDERTADGRVARVATIFLTGRECPWRCVMCDLWRYTIEGDTPRNAIPTQIASARDDLESRGEAVTHLKLYNASSFFDPHAVPEDDYDPVAAALAGLERVVVESHPALIGPRVDRFLESLARHSTGPGFPSECGTRSSDRAASAGAEAATLHPADPVVAQTRPSLQLEVAMGLETAHPEALRRLNKRMTADGFAMAAERLRGRGLTVRAFLLILPPFVPSDQQDDWLIRSLECAFSSGVSVASLIPTRSGNGAMNALAAEGHFNQPSLADIERSIELAVTARRGAGRVFVDLWDLERFARCPHCFDARRARLHVINLEQRIPAKPSCAECGVTS
jgi:uncharacterized Fe-S cluster-containing MiaB family protein